MNFFDAQDRARRASKWLVVVYAIATVLIVAGVTLIVGAALYYVSGDSQTTGQFASRNAGLLTATAAITALFIVGSSIYKTSSLSAGGGRVAVEMGGTLVSADVTDPLRRRLRNVVEEMAIASGVPVPEIYVLEEESAINAFAAGYTPGDAAIAVTRGTLELLDRNELQGVVAHEFSHILNGDMRLNIRMMGVLFGILVLGLIGRLIVRGGYHTSIVSRRDRSAPVAMLVGIGLVLLGAIGMFFARIIKAAVSRQREYLADASAVQYTRQTSGIANALKKIGGYHESSLLTASDPEQVSHMLFGTGAKFFGMFATHPPLTERIKALDPAFNDSDYPRVDSIATRDSIAAGASEQVAGFAPSTDATVAPEAIVDSAGQPGSEHVEYARGLRESIPAELYDAAHSRELALLLAVALVLDRSGASLDSQIRIVEERLGSERGRVVRRLFDALVDIDPEIRLPLLEIAFPSLKLRPAAQLEYLLELTGRLIEVDGKVDLYEYCYYRILHVSIGQAINPARRRAPNPASRAELRSCAIDLLTVVAEHGHDDRDEQQAAFDAGRDFLGKWASAAEFSAKGRYTTSTLDHSLDVLLGLNGKSRRRLVRAVSTVAAHDGRLSAIEGEMIRAICATLEVPLPPVVATISALSQSE